MEFRWGVLFALLVVAVGASERAVGQVGAPDFASRNAAYEGRVITKVRHSLVWADETSTKCLVTSISLRLSPSGEIQEARIAGSSGNQPWDEAVLNAFRRTNMLPRDTDGRVPAQMVIRFAGEGDGGCAGARMAARQAQLDSSRVAGPEGTLRDAFAARVGEAVQAVRFAPGSWADVALLVGPDGRVEGVERVAESGTDRRWSAAVLLSVLRVDAVSTEVAQASRKWLLHAESAGSVSVRPLETRPSTASR